MSAAEIEARIRAYCASYGAGTFTVNGGTLWVSVLSPSPHVGDTRPFPTAIEALVGDGTLTRSDAPRGYAYIFTNV